MMGEARAAVTRWIAGKVQRFQYARQQAIADAEERCHRLHIPHRCHRVDDETQSDRQP